MPDDSISSRRVFVFVRIAFAQLWSVANAKRRGAGDFTDDRFRRAAAYRAQRLP
jgi:hypothetical protein